MAIFTNKVLWLPYALTHEIIKIQSIVPLLLRNFRKEEFLVLKLKISCNKHWQKTTPNNKVKRAVFILQTTNTKYTFVTKEGAGVYNAVQDVK